MKQHENQSTCELLNGQKCEHRAELEKLKKELQITREFIHDHGLEWALLTYYKRREEGTP